jgi:hypothetical protein
MLNRNTLKDSYALITGASQGLGREFAFQLAALGLNLVLVARSELDLKETAEALSQYSNQKIKLIPADLTKTDDLAYILKTLQRENIRIRILVNNAGSGYWGHFDKGHPETYARMIDLNVKAPVLLTHHLFEDLKSFEVSAVINVSSLASVQPVPYMSVYAATKSFLSHYGMALWAEWERQGIYVQTLMPGAIETKFDEKSGGFQAPFRKDSASEIVKLSLNELLGRRRPLVYAKRSFSQRAFRRLLPLPFLIREVAKVFLPKQGA